VAGSLQVHAGDEELDGVFSLCGKVQLDYANDSGERYSDKPGNGSENKVAIMPTTTVANADHPRYEKLATVVRFCLAAIADKAQSSIEIACKVIMNGLACFLSLIPAGCSLWSSTPEVSN